nr:MAG TPA: hypothetical protein [Caudoviricetes sp.]
MRWLLIEALYVSLALVRYFPLFSPSFYAHEKAHHSGKPAVARYNLERLKSWTNSITYKYIISYFKHLR